MEETPKKHLKSKIADVCDRYAKYVFTTPSLIVVLIIFGFPLIYNFWLSFHAWFVGIGTPKFIGLDNYYELIFKNERFRMAVLRTFYYSMIAVSIQTVLGVIAALVFNEEFRGRGFLRVLYILPIVTTPVSIALVWVMIYHPDLGVANYFLQVLHLPRSLWIHSKKTVIPALVLTDTWQWTPLIMLIVLGALAARPKNVYEAAEVDGATGWQTFWYITLPYLRPALLTAVLFRSIDAIKTFDIIFVMTQGGPGLSSETINLLLFSTGFYYYHMGKAAAMVVLFFAIIIAISFIIIHFRRKEVIGWE
jgi:multiple sugar transport system permease protein